MEATQVLVELGLHERVEYMGKESISAESMNIIVATARMRRI